MCWKHGAPLWAGVRESPPRSASACGLAAHFCVPFPLLVFEIQRHGSIACARCAQRCFYRSNVSVCCCAAIAACAGVWRNVEKIRQLTPACSSKEALVSTNRSYLAQLKYRLAESPVLFHFSARVFFSSSKLHFFRFVLQFASFQELFM